MTNQSTQAAPAGLGWHPYFVKRAGSRIALRASGRWEMGPDKLPTRRAPVAGLDAECASLDVDHCFDGWDGVAQLRDDAHAGDACAPTFARWWCSPATPATYVAIEPVSHVNNAVHLYAAGVPADDLGLRVLQPGESMMAQMAIEVEAA